MRLSFEDMRLALAFCAVAAGLAAAFGVTYTSRLPEHQGIALVRVVDRIAVPVQRPRHTVFVLIDGLGRSHAEGMRSMQRLRGLGQCRLIDMLPISLSRPVYAMLSTGLEQDRTGVRVNAEKAPIAARSLWDVARAQRLSVTASTHLPWWRQLFPEGFSEYELAPMDEDVFARARLADFTLIHPLYVDAAGHRSGAASDDYRDAVQRADRELSTFLERLDLERDLVSVTSDHGHAPRGGHGGVAREISQVLWCLAGRGVRPGAALERFDARAVAPTLAVASGVPFPDHMRAHEDELDALFGLLRTEAFPGEYLADRRRAIEHFRAKNRAALGAWLGDEVAPSWAELYARGRRAQWLRFGIALLALGSLLVWLQRRSGASLGHGVYSVLWASTTFAATLAVYVLTRGSLDLTSINLRTPYLIAAVTVSVVVALAAWFVHQKLWARPAGGGFVLLTGLELAALGVHPCVFGWRMGAPLPGPELLFLPLLVPVPLAVHAAAAAMLLLRERAAK